MSAASTSTVPREAAEREKSFGRPESIEATVQYAMMDALIDVDALIENERAHLRLTLNKLRDLERRRERLHAINSRFAA